jgi:hypothetical protein
MSHRSRMLQIDQSPNGHDELVSRIMQQGQPPGPALPALEPSQFIAFLLSNGAPVGYGTGRTPDPAHPVQVATTCGAIGIPANLTVAAARSLAAQICAICDQIDAELVPAELPHPVPESIA